MRACSGELQKSLNYTLLLDITLSNNLMQVQIKLIWINFSQKQAFFHIKRKSLSCTLTSKILGFQQTVTHHSSKYTQSQTNKQRRAKSKLSRRNKKQEKSNHHHRGKKPTQVLHALLVSSSQNTSVSAEAFSGVC